MILSNKILVTYALFTYNQEKYVEEAILSAFSQNYENLEIIISDDNSTDRTFEIIKEIKNKYQGRNNIIINRNNNNIGIAKHFEYINQISSGEIVVGAAGDDISRSDRVSKIVDMYNQSNKNIHYFYSRAVSMDLSGNVLSEIVSPGASNSNCIYKAALSPWPIAIGATQAWSKNLVTEFGPINNRIQAEDQILGLRGLILGKIGFIDEDLVLYRVGSGVSTIKNSFNALYYYKNKINSIKTFEQKYRDTKGKGLYILSTMIKIKIIFLIISFPISPLISIFNKIIKNR
jgi:glycosyltransferase involved in cell wall biosynthesis